MFLRRRKRNDDRKGATAVEMALVMPVFVLILFAMFEFTRMIVLRHTADNAAYEAARIAMVTGASANEAITEAQRIMNIVRVNDFAVNVDPSTITDETESVTVEISVPVDGNGWILPYFSSGQTIVSSSTLLTERARTR